MMIKRAYVDTPEGQIHYQFDGEGDVILLLHQSPQSSDQYRKVMPILAKNYKVIAMDNMGYGKSDKPSRFYEIEDYARSAHSFLTALGISKASIAGHHTGASIAVEVAVNHPQMVNKLILYGCPTFEPQMREKLLHHPRYQPIELAEDGSHLLRLWQSRQKSTPKAGMEIWQETAASALLAGTDMYAGERAVFSYQEELRLPLVKTRTLLISGTEDFFHPRLEIVKGLIPDCTTRIIEGGDAQVTLRMPKEFAQTILDFLK